MTFKELQNKLILLETNEKLLKGRIRKLNKKIKELNNMLDDVPVLRGKAAEEFEKYNSRPATEEEIKYMKEAKEFYLLASTEERESRKNARLARGILTNRYDGVIMGKCMKIFRGKISGEVIDTILKVTKSTILDDVMKNLNVLHEVEA